MWWMRGMGVVQCDVVDRGVNKLCYVIWLP